MGTKVSKKSATWLCGIGVAIVGLSVLLFDFVGETAATDFGIASSANAGDDSDGGQRRRTLSSISDLRFAPQDGSLLAFQFQVDTTLESDVEDVLSHFTGLGAPSSGLRTFEIHGAGQLYVKYFAADPGNWNVAARIVGATYNVNGTAPNFAPELEYPFSFHMNDRGAIRDIAFVQGVSEDARGVIKSLLLTMAVPLPPSTKSAWVGTGQDDTGEYLARYRVENTPAADEWSVVRRKMKYLPRSATLDITTKIQEAETRATIDRDASWVTTVTHRQSVTQSSDGRPVTGGSSRMSATRIPALAEPKFPATFAKAEADRKSEQWALAHTYRTVPALTAQARGLDFSGALSAFGRMRAERPNDANAFLLNYLRLHPEAAEQLAKRLSGGRDDFDADTKNALWSLIARSGHKEAQAAIMNTVLDDQNPSDTRIRALAYVSDFEYPTDAVVEELWDQYELPVEEPQSTAGQIKTMSLFALGALGAGSHLDPEAKESIGQELSSALNGSDTAWDERMALRAIGNFGGAELLDDVADRFESPDPAIRAAAFMALRKMTDPRAQSVFIAAFEREPSPEVRASALASLVDMPLRAPTIDWARVALFEETGEAAQVGFVRVLGETIRRYPDNGRVLREYLATRPSMTVKRAIYDYIAPIP